MSGKRIFLRADEMSEAEFCRHPEVSISRPTNLKWRKRGFGPPASRRGHSLIYKRKDVEDWLAGRMPEYSYTPAKRPEPRKSAPQPQPLEAAE